MMKNKFLYMLLVLIALLLTGQNVQAQQTWDFASLDANDADLIEAEITAATGNWYHNTDSKKNRYSYVKALEKAPIMANGQELTYTKGLLFTFAAVASGEGNFRAGNDTSNKRAWMSGGSITILNLTKGMRVTVMYMSSSKSDTGVRGISVENLTPDEGSKFNTNNKGGDAKDAITDTGTVTEDGDVTLTMTKAEGSSYGMYLYMIKVEDPSEDEEGGGDEPGGDDPTPIPVENDYSTSANSMKNQAVLTLVDGSKKYYNTEDLASIDFDGGNITVTKDAENAYVFENKVAEITFNKAENGQDGTLNNEDGKVEIIEAKGWLESAYVKFKKFEGASTYHVYVKGGQYASYTRIDKELVRDYDTYGRADMVGLKSASDYAFKIVPVNGETELTANENEVTGLVVKNYSRQGFAFMNGFVPGAYQADGTLKDGAKVFYITKNSAKTIKTTVTVDNKGKTEECEGFQAIIDAYQKGYDKTPIAFRFIGLVEKGNLDGISSSAEGIQIKGKNADSPMPFTIEGIGDDATIRGFGFLVRNSKGVEFRNLGIMRCMDDGISMDTDNSNIWAHHMDMFYGPKKSGDQVKGDGAIDVKADSKFVTVSYNRFWDTGKSNMFGMKSESGPNYISYDHNWFDHSDSRHPRIRTMSVHVWNNYFDNVAKYGVGATSGSSVFVENNYFLKTKKPILSSLQGTDGLGDGTFSGEDGGMIKAYGNYFDRTAPHFSYYTQKNPSAKGYDAYETATRDAQVPESEKTLVGATMYNNFDTDASKMYTYTADAASQVPSVVTGFYGAGRMNHGDFTYTFKDNVGSDKEDSAFDETLSNMLNNYKSKLVGIFGEETSQGGGDEPGGGDQPGGGDEPGGGDQPGGGDVTPTPEGTILCSFPDKNTASNALFTVSGNLKSGVAARTIDGVEYKTALKMETTTSITFSITKPMKMTLYFDATPSVTIDDVKTKNLKGATISDSGNDLSITLAAGNHVITKDGTINLYLIKLEPIE